MMKTRRRMHEQDDDEDGWDDTFEVEFNPDTTCNCSINVTSVLSVFDNNTKIDEITDLAVPEETEIKQVSFIEDSWYKKRLWLWILWPISRLIKSIAIRRRNKFLLNSELSWKPDIPVIVVGNIIVGGSG